jgi:uncharacterized protein (DUF433 family)
MMRQSQDPREVPMYEVAVAASYVGIPASTLRTWVFGRPFPVADRLHWSDRLIEPADEKRRLLSFANLAEAHILQATREHRIPVKKVRTALDYLRDQAPGIRHPLLTEDFYAFQKDLFIKRLQEIVNVGRGGQLALDFLDSYLERLVRDESGLPFRFFPMRQNRDRHVMVDMHISSGQPVLAETGILAEILHGRNIAGESAEEIARDYGLDERSVIDAIRYIAAAA